ncbi:MAG: Fic family protein [Rhodococcus sp. (in: high G+C Gram-positive bacteria)]|uniref:Fic family protein n=1 Tax=Rhodococcus sp. TaxID=1831 RepID=UPI003BB7227A
MIRAVVAHFIFEYTHPFYDGNGRTGRYLLALDLRQVLAPYAGLALSATVADNKDRHPLHDQSRIDPGRREIHI